MFLKEDAKKIREVLSLSGSPVAITYSQKPALGADETPRPACKAIIDAKDGVLCQIHKDNCSCKGEIYYLGFQEHRAIDRGEEFLVDVEHIFSSYRAARAFINDSLTPPFGLAKYVVFSPLGESNLKPDLIVFVCTPFQASRILGLVAYDSGGVGMNIKTYGFNRATCEVNIGMPLLTGDITISLIDPSAKHRGGKISDNELILTLPVWHFRSVMDNIDYAIAGTAKPSRDILADVLKK